jgi:hypothetical protein
MIFDSWTTIGVMWSIAGVATLALADAAMRHEEGEGIFEQCRSVENTVAMVLILLLVLLFWPVAWIAAAVLAFRPDLDPDLKAPLRRASHRKPRLRIAMPRLDSPWWKPAEHDSEVLSRMIRLRLKRDPRLAGAAPPWRWPRDRLWRTTEAMLLEAVQQYLALWTDGLSAQDIVRRIEDLRGAADGPPTDPRLRPYLRWRLAQADPDYLRLGHRVFAPAALQAIRWARKSLLGANRADPFPPAEWLVEEISPDEVEPAFEGLFFPAGPRPENWREALIWKRREWALMKLRLREGDDVMQYQEPPAADAESAGQHGIALVRDGRAVAWIPAVAAEDIEEEEIE